jgi:hypothetical protein
VAHVSTPLAGLVPIDNVIDAELLVTVFPPASCTVTIGCTDHTELASAPAGCWVYATFVGAPTEIANDVDVALVRAPVEATNV